MKKILVTGGSGLLGINWILDRRVKNKVHFLLNNRYISIKGATGYFVNFEDKKKVFELIQKIKPDILINTIGLTDINLCEENKKKAMFVNCEIAVYLSKIAYEEKIKFVNISTDHLFDGNKKLYTEESSPNPLNHYGESKLIAEKLVQKENPKALIIRSNFFGWGPLYRNSISDRILSSDEKKEKFEGIDNVFFTPVSTKKLIEITHKLINKNYSGVINISSSERISKYQFALKLSNHFKLDVKLIKRKVVPRIQKPVQRPLDLSLSNKKLLSILNIKPLTIENSINDLKKELSKRNEILSLGKPITYGRHYIDDVDIKEVVKVLKSDSLTQGPMIDIFEKRIANYVGAKFAVAVSSATAGLHLSYLAFGLSKNDKVITSPITFVSTANAALFCNANVQFIDVDKDTLIIDQSKLESMIKKDKDVKIIAPVLFGGSSEGMDKIYNFSKSNNKFVVEDAAHCLGGSYISGEKIGSCKYSDCTVFSLHPVKSIAAGEGGVVTTNNREVYLKLLRLRSHGINKLDDAFINKDLAYTNNDKNMWYYEMTSLGYHYRITDIQISLANSQLNKLPEFIKKRVNLVNRYKKLLKNIPHIKPAQKINSYKSANHIFPVLINFEKLSLSRHYFMRALVEKNIFTQVHYMPVYKHPFYNKRNLDPGNCINSENYYNKALSLPLYFSLTYEDQDYVVNVLENLILRNLKK